VKKERKRDAKLKLKEAGVCEALCEEYATLLAKDKLTPMEKIKESCLTELIESLGASLNESID